MFPIIFWILPNIRLNPLTKKRESTWKICVLQNVPRILIKPQSDHFYVLLLHFVEKKKNWAKKRVFVEIIAIC